MNRPIVLGVAALLLFALGVIAANTRIAQGVIPVTAYEADVNKDTRVNSGDQGLVASNYGKPVPTATATPSAHCDLSGWVFDSGGLQIRENGGGTYPLGPHTAGFTDCNFSRMRAIGIDCSVSTFERANFTLAHMVGNCYSADFTDADFTGAYFAGQLAWSSFVNVNLTNATLDGGFMGADFTGAITTGADVSNVGWLDTTCPDATNSDNNGGSCIGHGFAGTPLATWTPTATPTATATPETCAGASANARWTSGNGHCYQRFDVAKVFVDAELDCESRSGHLVTITSQAEQDFVFASVTTGDAFIGITDQVLEGDYRWVNGESFSYTNWNGGEPNNGGGNPAIPQEDAAIMGTFAGGLWNDVPVDILEPYICESS